MSKINRPKIPVGFEYPVYKIVNILDINTGKRKESCKEGQYYNEWIGMTAFSMEDIDMTCCGFPIIFHYMFDKDGHPISGWMHTSNVTSVEKKDEMIYVYTLNSVYIMTKIHDVQGKNIVYAYHCENCKHLFCDPEEDPCKDCDQDRVKPDKWEAYE